MFVVCLGPEDEGITIFRNVRIYVASDIA